MTLNDLRKILNRLRQFINDPEMMNTEINNAYKEIREKVSSDLDKLIFETFQNQVEQFRISLILFIKEKNSIKNAKIKGKNIWDRFERNRKKLILNLKKIFKKKEIKEKEKLVGIRLKSEYNSIKRIIRNTVHRSKEKVKDVFFNKAKKVIDIKKKWITSFRNSRDAHIDMHNQIADKNGWFYAPSGERTKNPGGFGVARLDINCGCRIKIIKA